MAHCATAQESVVRLAEELLERRDLTNQDRATLWRVSGLPNLRVGNADIVRAMARRYRRGHLVDGGEEE